MPSSLATEAHAANGRAAAAELAAEIANAGDTILLAGKGAEVGQTIGGIVHPFDDRVVLRDALAARRVDATDQDGEG